MSGRNKIESPGGTLVAACLRVKNASKLAIKMSKRQICNTQLEQKTTPVVITNPKKVPSCENILLFSNSQEGVVAREAHRLKKPRCVLPEPFLPPSQGSWRNLSDDTEIDTQSSEWRGNFTSERESESSQTNDQKSEFYVMDTATLFYGYSSVLRTCYRTLFSRAQVSDFVKLCLSKRCKN